MPIDLPITLDALGLAALRQYFTRDPDRLLKRIGVVMLAGSQAAFANQRFGSVVWPERYPNQGGGEKLNVAGAVKDLANGPNIKSRRYDARPAGRDTGDLMGRLTAQVRGGLLEVGSDLPYAQRFHAGGESRLTITPQIKRNLGIFLRRKRKAAGREADRNGGAGRGPRGGAPKTLEERRLGFLFRVGELVTESPARPFAGITREMVGDIESLIKDDLERFAREQMR